MTVIVIDTATARSCVVINHYLHRAPSISYAYGLEHGGRLVGVLTVGSPASRSVQKSVCPTAPGKVLELNRLWVDDDMPRNTESWFISRCLRMLPPMLLCSYADTAMGHVGYVYRASNWYYAGLTDADRKTPRFDYVVKGKHSRSAFRGGVAQYTEKVRRVPKHRYWMPTGDRRERKVLADLCGWPMLKWKGRTKEG